MEGFGKRLGKVTLVIVVLSVLLVDSDRAQGEPVRLTLQIPVPVEESVIQQLEDQFTDVEVEITLSDESFFPNLFSGDLEVEEYYEDLREYTSSGDVLFVDSNTLLEPATDAGFFVDLRPLISADTEYSDDTVFAVRNSFEWNGGTWALPFAVSTDVVVYDITAFDAAGISYPTQDWAFSDYISAAHMLATGETPGFVVDDPSPFLTRFGGEVQTSTLAEWVQLEAEGIVGDTSSIEDTQTPPLTLVNIANVPQRLGENPTLAAILPTNQSVTVDAFGFAVSAGTANPEIAYELTKLLVQSPDIISFVGGAFPADRELYQAAEAEIFGDNDDFAAAVRAVLESAPGGNVTLRRALTAITLDRLRAGAAEVEVVTEVQRLIDDYERVAAEQALDPIVLPVTGAVVRAPDEPVLRYGVPEAILDIDFSRDELERLAEQFVQDEGTDIPVELVELDTSGRQQPETDCRFRSTTVPANNTTPFRNLDPLIAADPQFDEDDLLGDTLSLLQSEGQTWAFPMVIYPEVIRYNAQVFQEAGLPEPDGRWTFSTFADTLRTLDEISDETVFAVRSLTDTHQYLLMLLAANNALPIDYRTDPPTINLNDPAMVQAITEVLDFAKEGVIDYQRLGDVSGRWFPETPDALVFTELVAPYESIFPVSNEDSQQLAMTVYPSGAQYTPVSYKVGVSYINSGTRYPELCYRWISLLARHPYIFEGMPAFASLLEDETIATVIGPNALDFYQQFRAALDAPNRITFPSLADLDLVDEMEMKWVYRAFDAYILGDADLAAGLQTAAQQIQELRACTGTIPPLQANATPEAVVAYRNEELRCLFAVDPSMGNVWLEPPPRSE